MNLLDQIQSLLQVTFPNAHVEVHDMTGTGDHLELTVVSDIFKGHRLLDQHRMVMDALKQKFQENLHAVKIKTFTKEGFERQKKMIQRGQ